MPCANGHSDFYTNGECRPCAHAHQAKYRARVRAAMQLARALEDLGVPAMSADPAALAATLTDG
jgi:hypothetical protein